MEDLEIEANKELLHYRHEVHCYLDTLWLLSCKKSSARTTLYKWLSIQMNKDIDKTHVSQFTLDDCKQALHILKVRYKQITGKRNIPASIKKKLHINKDGKYDKELIKQIKLLNYNED